jgi:hypothetical protein
LECGSPSPPVIVHDFIHLSTDWERGSCSRKMGVSGAPSNRFHNRPQAANGHQSELFGRLAAALSTALSTGVDSLGRFLDLNGGTRPPDPPAADSCGSPRASHLRVAPCVRNRGARPPDPPAAAPAALHGRATFACAMRQKPGGTSPRSPRRRLLRLSTGEPPSRGAVRPNPGDTSPRSPRRRLLRIPTGEPPSRGAVRSTRGGHAPRSPAVDSQAAGGVRQHPSWRDDTGPR